MREREGDFTLHKRYAQAKGKQIYKQEGYTKIRTED